MTNIPGFKMVSFLGFIVWWAWMCAEISSTKGDSLIDECLLKEVAHPAVCSVGLFPFLTGHPFWNTNTEFSFLLVFPESNLSLSWFVHCCNFYLSPLHLFPWLCYSAWHSLKYKAATNVFVYSTGYIVNSGLKYLFFQAFFCVCV